MQHRARRLLTAALALVVPLSLTASTGAAGASDGRDREFVKVGYFIQWGIYGRNFFVRDLEDNGSAARLTHINYAFGNVTDGRRVSAPPPIRGPTTKRRSPRNEAVDGVGR